MKTRYIIPVFMLFFATLGVKAQTYNQGNKDAEMASFDNQNSELNFLSTQNNGTPATTPSFSGNNIYITQTGNGNKATSNTHSESSDIRITQNGDDNIASLNITANTIQETVIQNGNENKFIDYNTTRTTTADFHNGEIIQNGTGHNVEWYGGNSISEKLKVSQQGDGYGKTIIVRSFN